MSTQEIIRDVTATEVSSLVADFKAVGATVSQFAQADGLFTVVAVFAETPQLAPLAMTSPMEAEPATKESLAEALPVPTHSTQFSELAWEYRLCFDNCRVQPEYANEIKSRIKRLQDNAPRYKSLSHATQVPWQFIGIVHMLEANTNFGTHLHNGDPLSARTSHVPAGRPENGNPPFSWEDSAHDALEFEGMIGRNDWNVATMLYRFERFNGFGYREKNIWSPYLWSYSNLYEKGRFVEDHKFDPESVSKQCGAAVLLKVLQQAGLG